MRKAFTHHNDPKNLNRCQREHRVTVGIFEGQANEQSCCLCNVFRKDMKHKSLDVVKKPAALLNSV